MKRRNVVVLAFVLTLAVAAVAQDTRKSGDTTNSSANASTRVVTLSGSVSADGMSLTSGKDEWNVRNADVLSGYEGRTVTVKCLLNRDDATIRVLAVKSVTASYRANLSDSAFRR